MKTISRISSGSSHQDWGKQIEVEKTGRVEFFNGQWHSFYRDANGNEWVSTNGGFTVSNWGHNNPIPIKEKV